MNKLIILLLLMGWIYTNAPSQSVESFIQQAREYNPGLKAMRLDYQAALQKADQVNDWPDPIVHVGLGVLPVETRLGAQRFKLGVTQMIPWKGSLNAKSKVASAMAEIKAYDDDIAAIDMEYAIRSTYASIQFLEAQKDIIQQRLEILDALEALSKSALRSGKGQLSNVLLVERQREMLETDLALIDKKIEQPTIQINRWTGNDLDHKIQIDQDVDIYSSRDEIIRFAQADHPMYKRLENHRLASDAQLELLRYDEKPKIGVGLEYAYISGRNNVEIAHNGRDVLMPMGSISIPIHTGRFSAKRQEEVLRQEAIDRKIEEVNDKFIAEIELAYSTIEYAEEVIDRYLSLKEITYETLKLMRTEYATEGTRFEELLRLEMELIDFDLEMIKAKYEKVQARTILLKYK